MKLDGAKCPSCHGGSLQTAAVHASDMEAGDTITVKACRDCCFAWQWPPQRNLESSIAHAKTRYSEPQDNDYYKPEQREKVASTQLGFVESLDPPGRRLLDVGAGDGAFVRVAAAHGWEVVGLDPAAPQAVAGNPSILQMTLEQLPADEQFDVITLWDVIEHLDFPLEVLAQAVTHLKPGGLLVAETGNYQSANRLHAGDSWWAYAADHRWYFAPPVVERMFRSLDLTDIQRADRVLRPGWQGDPQVRPWLGGHIRSIIKRPDRTFRELGYYLRQRSAAQRWPHWGGLPIFSMVGRRPS